MIANGKLLGYKSIIATPVDTTKVDWSSDKSRTWPDLNIELFQADNEDLSVFMPDAGQIDSLVANLSLHIVNNPTLMLKECFRVVKPGGRAAFSVWGPEEHSYWFTIPKNAGIKFGDKCKDAPIVRDHWHLKDRNELIQLLEDAGFTDVQVWEHFVAFLPLQPDKQQSVNKQNASSVAPEGSEVYNKALDYIQSEIEKVTTKDKRPIGLNCLIAVCTKKS